MAKKKEKIKDRRVTGRRDGINKQKREGEMETFTKYFLIFASGYVIGAFVLPVLQILTRG